MAYIIQHRRDTAENWRMVNPVLADAEIGFILEEGSSLYKIGDGKTAWNSLPLFGFGGNVYNNFSGSDLETSVPSRQAVLDRLNSIIDNNLQPQFDSLTEGKVNQSQISQDFIEKVGEDETKMLISKKSLIDKFDEVIKDITDNYTEYTAYVTLTTEQINILKEFAEATTVTLEEHTTMLTEHATMLEEHAEALDANTKYIVGFDEVVDTEETDPETGEPITETIHHKGIDERFEDVSTSISEVDEKVDSLTNDINTKHQILSEEQYAAIGDFSSYPEGTLFFTYKNQ